MPGGSLRWFSCPHPGQYSSSPAQQPQFLYLLSLVPLHSTRLLLCFQFACLVLDSGLALVLTLAVNLILARTPLQEQVSSFFLLSCRCSPETDKPLALGHCHPPDSVSSLPGDLAAKFHSTHKISLCVIVGRIKSQLSTLLLASVI